MARWATLVGGVALWATSLYPAARLAPALPLLLSPLAGMVCDAPQTPCLRVLLGFYAIFLLVFAQLGAGTITLLYFTEASWKAALMSNAISWSLYALVLPSDWRP